MTVRNKLSLVRRRPYHFLLPAILAILVSWEALSQFGHFDKAKWSRPSEMLSVISYDLSHAAQEHADQNSARSLMWHVGKSLWRFSLGFACAAVFGIGMGFVLGISRTAYALGHPIVNFVRALPSAAIWPVCALLVGFGQKAQLIVICFGATWPCLINSMDAVRTLAIEIHDSLAFMRIGRLRRWVALLHWASPGMFTGLEVSCAVAFLLTVSVEIFWPANGGLGWYLTNYTANTPDADRLFGALLLIAILGWSVNTAMRWARGKLIFWEDSGNEGLVRQRHSRPEAVMAKVKTELSRAILISDKVTETIEVSIDGAITLEVLYQDKPYMRPDDLRKHLGTGSRGSDEVVNVTQRDIRIRAKTTQSIDGVVLFSRSWIQRVGLTPLSRQKLDEGRETIGQIIRACESNCSYRTLWYQGRVSDKLGKAFESQGTIEVVQRARLILIRGDPVILIHEFVPL